MKLVNFASLDPTITRTGRKGLGNVSDADREVWNEFHADWEKLALESERLLKSLGGVDRTNADGDVAALVDYAGGTRATLVETRLKQSFFRRAVLSSYGGRCCISGLSVPQLLTASHIVPWAEDRRNRLNPSNGLCLSALHDRAFDQGLLTVLPDMTIKLSKRLAKSEDRFVGTALRIYDGKKIRAPERFCPHADFLEYHNRRVFNP
jgi:predicted restriction endonuclease